MTTQNYPIQGNQFFNKVENTVVSTTNVEDVLNNSEVLVTRVVKGITAPIDANKVSEYAVYSKETMKELVLPAGALVTRVLVANDKSAEAAKRLKMDDAKFNFILKTSGGVKQAITENKEASSQLGSNGFDPLASTLVVEQKTTLDDGTLLLDLTTGAVNSPTSVIVGTMTVEFHYVVPQL